MSTHTQHKLGSNYLLGEELGAGVMGSVFSAESVLSGDRVAAKILHPHLTDDRSIVTRFVSEREALSRVEHPNVVSVFDFVLEQNKLAIIMELVDGGNLSDLISNQPIDVATVVRLAKGIALGLEAIHQADIIHRDLKPANVLMADNVSADITLQPKISDFGVSKITDTATHLKPTASIGTPRYMAPEMASGEGEISNAVDMYSLGVVLYEMLVGQAPFTGSAMEVMYSHLGEEPPVIKGVPRGLSDLVSALLSKSPVLRPSAAEVARKLADIESVLDGTERAYVQEQRPTSTSEPKVKEHEPVLLPRATAQIGQFRYSLDLPSSLRRSAGAPLIGGVVVFTVILGAVLLLRAVFGGDSETISTESDIDYAFAPAMLAEDVALTRLWILIDEGNAIKGRLTVTNTSDDVFNGNLVELITPTLISTGEITFEQLPDRNFGDGVFSYTISGLQPQSSLVYEYVINIDPGPYTLERLQQMVDMQLVAGPAQGNAAGAQTDAHRLVATKALEELELSNSRVELRVGERFQFRVNGRLSDASAAPAQFLTGLAWVVDDPELVSVSINGELTALQIGETTVTARLGELSSSATVTVLPAPAITSEPVMTGVVQDPDAPTVTESTVTSDESKPSSLTTSVVDSPVEELPAWPAIVKTFEASSIGTQASVVLIADRCTDVRFYHAGGVLYEPLTWPEPSGDCMLSHSHNFSLEPDQDYQIMADLLDEHGRTMTLGPISIAPDQDELAVVDLESRVFVFGEVIEVKFEARGSGPFEWALLEGPGTISSSGVWVFEPLSLVDKSSILVQVSSGGKTDTSVFEFSVGP